MRRVSLVIVALLALVLVAAHPANAAACSKGNDLCSCESNWNPKTDPDKKHKCDCDNCFRWCFPLAVIKIAAPLQVPPPPQAPPVRLDYAACKAHVASGGRAILAVGVDASPGTYYVAELEDTAPGLWECYLKDGRLMMEPLKVPKAMAKPEKPARQWVKQCVDGVCRWIEVNGPAK